MAQACGLIACLPRAKSAKWRAVRIGLTAPPGGMGIGIENDETGRYFYHSDNNGRALMSFMIGHPASGRGIVILTNGEGGNTLYQKVLARLIEADLISMS